MSKFHLSFVGKDDTESENGDDEDSSETAGDDKQADARGRNHLRSWTVFNSFKICDAWYKEHVKKYKFELCNTFNIMLRMILSRIIYDSRITGTLGILSVEIQLYRNTWINVVHFKDGNLVCHLRPEIHVFWVIQLHQEISRKSSIKTWDILLLKHSVSKFK